MSVDLRVDWCDYKAAKFAVEHWHYSRSMPTPPVLRIGAWENGKFVGVVLFSRGSTNNLGKPYGLKITEVCELTRIALSVHQCPVSQILARAIRIISSREHGLRLIVSFADPDEHHHGGVYQANNWIYTGQASDYYKFEDRTGRVWHPRQVSATGYKKQYGEYRKVPKIAECKAVLTSGKHRYLYPLDRAMRKQIAPLAKPYPKREAGGQSVEGDTSGDQPEEAGSIPAARSDLG